MNRENDRDEELMFTTEETTTYPQDDDSMLRINALAFAIECHRDRAGSAEEVVLTADKFFKFLSEV